MVEERKKKNWLERVIFILLAVIVLGGVVLLEWIKDQGTTESGLNLPTPELTLQQLNRTCYGFRTEKIENSAGGLVWLCSDGYAGHDPSGIQIPRERSAEKPPSGE